MRRLAYVALVVGLWGCTSQRPSMPDLRKVEAEAARKALASGDPAPSETYLEHFPNGEHARAVRQHLVEIEARHAVESGDLGVMESFLLRFATHPVADTVFDAYRRRLLEEIRRTGSRQLMEKFVLIWPSSPQARSFREAMAEEELRALGPSPSTAALVALASKYPDTAVARRCEAMVARRRLDHGVLFGGPQAWKTARGASPRVVKAVVLLRIARALAQGDRDSLEALGPTGSALARQLARIPSRIRRRLGKLLAQVHGPSTSLLGISRMLMGPADPLQKRDVIWMVIHRPDPRVISLLVDLARGGDLFMHVVAIRALKYRISLEYEWDRVAVSLLVQELAGARERQSRLVYGWLRLLSGNSGGASVPPPSGSDLRELFLAMSQGRLDRAGFVPAIRSRFDTIRRDYPRTVGQNNLSLALAYLRTVAALSEMARSCGDGELAEALGSFMESRLKELGPVLRAMDAELPDLSTVPVAWHSLAGAGCFVPRKMAGLLRSLYPYLFRGCGR